MEMIVYLITNSEKRKGKFEWGVSPSHQKDILKCIYVGNHVYAKTYVWESEDTL